MSEQSLDKLVSIAVHLVENHFGLEKMEIAESEYRLDSLKKELRRVIAYLLEKDFEKLINAMYRIDIDEEKVRYALSGVDEREPVDVIVDLVVERELQKAELRLKYKS